MPPPVLQADAVTKRFPGVLALDRVSFDLMPGEIHALVGENGAGKSTLIKVLSGVHPHGTYDGAIRVQGRPAAFASTRDSEAAGLAVIYQELALVSEMTVAENIFLGREPRGWNGLVDWLAAYEQARRWLARFGLAVSPEAPVGTLGVGQQQLVEIVKALSRQSRILILDEPTAALSDQEVAILLDTLRDLRRQGVSCIYISHRLDEVFGLADRITVLRDGRSVETLDAKTAGRNRIIRLMVGREITEMFPRAPTPGAGMGPAAGHPLLTVRGLSVASAGEAEAALENISFEVRAGEVLGMGGLMGAGRTELLLHLFGAWGRRLAGSVTLAGRPLDQPDPRRAIRHGLTLVSDDRKRYGLVLEQSVGFNLSLSSLREITGLTGLIDQGREVTRNRQVFESLRIKAPNLESRTGQLSGGNQQKVVLGKAMLTQPQVIFMDEPTRGIDVGAKVEVYELINRLTDQGRAVVLVSSELPELMGMSDRILMLHEGRIGGEFTRAEATPEKLMAAALGHGAPPVA